MLAFSRELAKRSVDEAELEEREAAEKFDGAALAALIKSKYDRSYDISLKSTKYMGKVFVSLNIMWKYREQQSYALSEEDYMLRMEYAAQAIKAWGAVLAVTRDIQSRKQRPKVGKAVSIMIPNVTEEEARKWLA